MAASSAPMVKPLSINTDFSHANLKKIYWGLGPENKWMECIDGRHHGFGKKVFDEGLHGCENEPGFINSMEKAFKFLEDQFHKKIDADWYLQLHKLTCSHFDGENTNTLMGQEKVGVFRNIFDKIVWRPLSSDYSISKGALAEFKALDKEIKKELGEEDYGLGIIDDLSLHDKQRPTRFSYKPMRQEYVRRIFDKFVKEFYQEIDRSTTADEKLWAIAGFQQRLEWLHPVMDGNSRTDVATMNFLLTEYGFHPAILEYPHVSSCYAKAQWKQYLHHGLLKWERLKHKFKVESPQHLISFWKPDISKANL